MALNFVKKTKQEQDTAKASSKKVTAGTIVKKTEEAPQPKATKSTKAPVAKASKAATQTATKTTPTQAKKTVTKKSSALAKKTAGVKVVSPTELKKKIKELLPDLAEAKRKADEAAKVAAGVKKDYTSLEGDALDIVYNSGLDGAADLKVEHGNITCTIGVEKETRTIKDNVEVFNALQELDPELPWKLLGFKLSDLDKYLGKTQLDKLIDVAQTGKRTLTLKVEK